MFAFLCVYSLLFFHSSSSLKQVKHGLQRTNSKMTNILNTSDILDSSGKEDSLRTLSTNLSTLSTLSTLSWMWMRTKQTMSIEHEWSAIFLVEQEMAFYTLPSRILVWAWYVLSLHILIYIIIILLLFFYTP